VNATLWGLIALFLLFPFDLLIAATRVGLVNARPSRLQSEDSARRQRTRALMQNPRLYASLRLSQTLVRFSMAVLAASLALSLTKKGWSVPLVLLILGGILLLAEFSIEGAARRNPESWALRLTGFGRALLILFTPFVLLPLLALRPQNTPSLYAHVTEDELKNWIEEEGEEGSLEREERRMIYEIFQFGETMAREIMVPRIDVRALDANTSIADAAQVFLESGYSRLPVYENTIDNILGLLYAKDLLRIMATPNEEASLRDLLRPAYFVPETKKADDLLSEMQAQRIHMAIVVDEYGGVSGVVTLEDIIEEIIGEIQDEYDQSEELPYQILDENEYLFQGRIDLDDFAEIVGIPLPDADADTLAGFLYEKLGRVPQGGETLQTDGLILTIEQVVARRIRRVRVRRLSPEEAEHDPREN
jgi:CBS domain containing-hemolysin-like protein